MINFIVTIIISCLVGGCGVEKVYDENIISNNTPQDVVTETQSRETVMEEEQEAVGADIICEEPITNGCSWEITQYGARDINSSFYTIYNPAEGLIVIDGGWTDDAAYVRDVINSFGVAVDAWILTHPHQDHIGAFNAIYPELGEITVKNVYTVNMAAPDECLAVAPWDSVDAYNDFLSLNVSNLNYVNSGDVLSICGLQFEILSAFDENVRTFSRDYLNDGSMMFKVYGKEKTFLFCADVGISMSDFLLQRYGADKFAADYLQMGHHGNGGLNDSFYQAVCPQIAFFDAPDWLMYDDTGKYDTPQNISFMENLGSEIVGFNKSPYTVILK